MKRFQIINWSITIVFLSLLAINKHLGYMQVMLIRNDMMYWTIFFPVFFILFIVAFVTTFIKMLEKGVSVPYVTTLISSIYWFFLIIFFDRFYMTISDSLQVSLILIGLAINIVPIVYIFIDLWKGRKHENSNI